MRLQRKAIRRVDQLNSEHNEVQTRPAKKRKALSANARRLVNFSKRFQLVSPCTLVLVFLLCERICLKDSNGSNSRSGEVFRLYVQTFDEG